MARRKIKSATDQRKFTIVYNDFLESDLLDKHEKLIYIAIKRFADNETLTAFPSLKTLHKMTGISIRWIKRSIERMEEIGVISVEHRTSEEKGNESNLYTLHDYAEIWSVGSSEDIAAVADEISEMKLVAELRSRGYTVIKEKGLVSGSDQTTDTSTMNYNSSKENDSTDKAKSQAERYTMQDIKTLYEYDSLIMQHPDKMTDIGIVFDILYETLNTTKQAIRIGGEDKPQMVVIGKLMKLQPDDLIYSIEKYHEQDQRIKNPKSYLLTILYSSREQNHLDLMNLGHTNHDF